MPTTGLLNTALLTPVQGGLRLLSSAAASWLWVAGEVHRRFGWTPQLNDAYRDYDRQVALFTERYQTTWCEHAPGKVDRRWWDGRWWYRKPGMDAAAVPGTSNHGRGDTIDVAGLGGFDSVRYAQFAAVATEAGWDNAEGRAVGEYWHWQHFPGRDHHAGAGATSTSNARPTNDEEDLVSVDAERMLLLTYKQETGRQADDRGLYGWLRAIVAGQITLEQAVEKIDGSDESNVWEVKGLYAQVFGASRNTTADEARWWIGHVGGQTDVKLTDAQVKAIRDGLIAEKAKGAV